MLQKTHNGIDKNISTEKLINCFFSKELQMIPQSLTYKYTTKTLQSLIAGFIN